MTPATPDNPSTPEYRIGKIAKELDLGQYTLKHYERSGLIEPATSEAGFRFYTREDVGKIIYIRSMRRLGFSVEEIGAMLMQDADASLATMQAKLEENKRAIADLQRANQLLHRHIASLSGNLERTASPVFDAHARGLVFVEHFRGDELAGGSTLLEADTWRGLYERSLLGIRVEREHFDAASYEGCWWGLVPLGSLADVRAAMEERRSEETGGIIEVPDGPALLLSATLACDDGLFMQLRDLVRGALATEGRTLAGDVVGIADAVHIREGVSMLTLTVRVPVAAQEG